MPWHDSADPEYVKAYRRAYYLKHKEHENRGRARRYREARKRQREYLIKNGLWPIIPEERRYEIPPNLRALVYAKLIKYGTRSKPRSGGTQRAQAREAEEILHRDGGDQRTGADGEGHRTGTGDTGSGQG